MADKTRIDPDLARAENARLKGIASRFQSAVDKIKADAAQHDGCWGNDKFGEAFGKSFRPGSEQMLENSGKVEEGVTGTTKQVEQAVDAFEKTDEINARNLTAAQVREVGVFRRGGEVLVDERVGGVREVREVRGGEVVAEPVVSRGGGELVREVVAEPVVSRGGEVSVEQVREVRGARPGSD